ncbi:MAG: hypothetical protein LRZ85_03285 [Alphaproteobacteria bacterium]|nr:hypothetical protein [Alphaproteobacteria bacterium]
MLKKTLSGNDIDLAAVNAFPCPQEYTPEEIYEEAKADIAAGAQHLDTVFDVLAFMDGDFEAVVAKLNAVRRAVDEHNSTLAPDENPVILKTIMQTAAFENYQDLFQACIMALECGADYLKTSTGKGNPHLNLDKDSASLMAGATLMQAVADFEDLTGYQRMIKISGGVGKTLDTAPVDTMRYKILMDLITSRPNDLRYGTSGGSLDSLRIYAQYGFQASPPSQNGPEPAGY